MAKTVASVAGFAVMLVLTSMPWDWLNRPLWGWTLLCVLLAVTPQAVVLEYICRNVFVGALSRKAGTAQKPYPSGGFSLSPDGRRSDGRTKVPTVSSWARRHSPRARTPGGGRAFSFRPRRPPRR
jgi:hypothetical protein